MSELKASEFKLGGFRFSGWLLELQQSIVILDMLPALRIVRLLGISVGAFVLGDALLSGYRFWQRPPETLPSGGLSILLSPSVLDASFGVMLLLPWIKIAQSRKWFLLLYSLFVVTAIHYSLSALPVNGINGLDFSMAGLVFLFALIQLLAAALLRSHARKAVLILLVSLSVWKTNAAERFSGGEFDSVEAFVAATKAFKLASSKGDMEMLFTVPEPGQPEDPGAGKPVTARAVSTSNALWADESHALIFVTAAPPTHSTPSLVGILYLLKSRDHHWHVVDHLRFVATGKYADLSAEITGNARDGAKDRPMPVVTIKEFQGGRGHSYQISAIYTVSQSKLIHLPPE